MTNQNKLPVLQCEITNGPSKFDFMVSQFDGKKVKFTFKEPMIIEPENPIFKIESIHCDIEVIINGSKAEDGSRQSWIGEFTVMPTFGRTVETKEFYYNTKTRKGHIRSK